MSVKKEEMIKKLKIGKIWPSIVGIFFWLMFSHLLLIIFFVIIIHYFMYDRMETSYQNAIKIGSIIDEIDMSQISMIDAINGQDEKLFYDALYILDKDGDIVTGYGGATFDLNTGDPLGANHFTPKYRDLAIYGDKDSIFYIVDGSNGDQLKIDKLVVNFFENIGKNQGGILAESTKTVLCQDYYWFGVPLTDNRMALIKNKIVFYSGDFMLTMGIGALTGLLMLLMITFFLTNLISNIRKQRRMTKILYTDFAVGGHNSLYFEHYAAKTLGSYKASGRTYAIVDVTLMKYRSFCTCHGVKEGEKLLGEIYAILSARTGKKEYCAYYGKSSYALMLECTDRTTGERKVNQIIEALLQSLSYSGMAFHAGIFFVEPTSGGKKRIPLVPEYYNCASAARALIADEAQSAVTVFDSKLLEEQLWEHRVEEKMQSALENEEFKVYVQPKYDPANDTLSGAEALVRWINDEDGFIPPGRFIPIFEKNGFITKLDDYMISHVAQLQAKWLAEGRKVVPVSINVSRAHFANPDLAQHICGLVDKYGVPHKYIEIELTESAFFDDKAALLSTVHKLNELGFEISMDDFGSGYSSLNSLKDLPLDVLKLDAEFFRGEDAEKRGEIVVSEAINLAKKLNMRIVAEGVEKKNQVDFLAGLGCDMIQGYYYAKPMPADEYAQRLGGADGSPAQAPQSAPAEATAPDENGIVYAQPAQTAEPVQAPQSAPAQTAAPDENGIVYAQPAQTAESVQAPQEQPAQTEPADDENGAASTAPTADEKENN